MVIALLGAAAVFFASMVLFSFIFLWSEKKLTKERMGDLIYKGGQAISWSDSLVERLDQMSWAQKLKPQLEKACLNIRPTEYGALYLLTMGVLTFLFSWAFGLSVILSISLSLAITPLASRFFLKTRRNVYRKRIDAQLSEVCRLFASTARAGLSIPQGLQIVVQEVGFPIKNELSIVHRELQLGKDLEGALKDLLQRVETRDLSLFVNALIIQRRAGGDLGRVMSEMANTMEERKIINKTIAAAVSQSKASAYMLPVMSIILAFVMSKLFGGISILFNSFFGIILVVIFVIFQIIGILLVRKIANIKI